MERGRRDRANAPTTRKSAMLRLLKTTGLGCVLLASSLGAQQRVVSKKTPVQPRGGLEGDVYLMMQSGDLKKIAANRVFLLRGDETTLASIDSVCARRSKAQGKVQADTVISA